jgi:heme o synthase
MADKMTLKMAGAPAVLGPSPLPRDYELARVADYWQLLKPRVMSLVVFTALVGYGAAPTGQHPLLGGIVILAIALASGAAGAINMWYDRDIDAVMQRTQSRPLPQGRIAPASALAFGVILTLAALLLMQLAAGLAASLLLAGASGFYIFIYTMWLKRRTAQNIVIGGAAGAFPPVIGWLAASGELSWAPWCLFLLIFLWTPAHFWALALYRHADYERAQVPMLPVVAGLRATKKQILLYTILLLPVCVLPPWMGLVKAGWASATYLSMALLLGAGFCLGAWQVWREEGEKNNYRAAKRLFGYSIFYLFALFALIALL